MTMKYKAYYYGRELDSKGINKQINILVSLKKDMTKPYSPFPSLSLKEIESYIEYIDSRIDQLTQLLKSLEN